MPDPVDIELAPTDTALEGNSSSTQEDGSSLDSPDAIIVWIERLIAGFEFDVIGLARRDGAPPYPLPTEPGTLAHLIETKAADYLQKALASDSPEVRFWRGGQRLYPDIELSNGSLGEQIIALDIKVARRKALPKRNTTEPRTQSRITLITGNTYFAEPDKKRRGIRRPFSKYAFHFDWVILSSIDEKAEFPEVFEVELVVAQTWQIASKSRSSSTRNYIGAVDAISDLRSKRGEFKSQEDFETYWRSFPWSKEATREELASEDESGADGI